MANVRKNRGKKFVKRARAVAKYAGRGVRTVKRQLDTLQVLWVSFRNSLTVPVVVMYMLSLYLAIEHTELKNESSIHGMLTVASKLTMLARPVKWLVEHEDRIYGTLMYLPMPFAIKGLKGIFAFIGAVFWVGVSKKQDPWFYLIQSVILTVVMRLRGHKDLSLLLLLGLACSYFVGWHFEKKDPNTGNAGIGSNMTTPKKP